MFVWASVVSTVLIVGVGFGFRISNEGVEFIFEY